jgi:hypothetical protein
MKSEGTQRSFSRKRFLGRWAPAWGAVALDPRGRRRRAPCRRPASACRRPHGSLRADPAAAVRCAEPSGPGGLLDANDPLAAGPEQLIVDPALSANNPNNPSQTAASGDAKPQSRRVERRRVHCMEARRTPTRFFEG